MSQTSDTQNTEKAWPGNNDRDGNDDHDGQADHEDDDKSEKDAAPPTAVESWEGLVSVRTPPNEPTRETHQTPALETEIQVRNQN